MRLLIIEDEEDLLFALKKGLKQEGYAIDLAMDGEEALELLEVNQYDGVVLDINLPKLDGFTLLQRLRADNHNIRVLILSAKDAVDDKVNGLDLGANDYLTKPFHLKELKARLRALFCRQFISMDEVMSFGGLTLDIPRRKVLWEGQEIPLTNKEFSLLRFFMLNHDKCLSSETIIEHVWDEEADYFSNVLRVHIYALRKKLFQATGKRTWIATAPAGGYQFQTEGGNGI